METYTLTTIIDGTEYKLQGKLSKDGKYIIMNGGVKCSIQDGDKLEEIQIQEEKKERKPRLPKTIGCPFDLHKWFNSQPKQK